MSKLIKEHIEKVYIPKLLNPVLNKIQYELKDFRNEDYIELFVAFYNQVREHEKKIINDDRIINN